jgi:hypothetical protein
MYFWRVNKGDGHVAIVGDRGSISYCLLTYSNLV